MDRAILDAAIALLCEEGLEGATIGAVAERAEISRPTIYRRHPNRHALVEAAVRHAFHDSVPAPRLGRSPRDDVLALLENTVEMLTRTPVGPLFRAMVPHLERSPALGRLANELGSERRGRLRSALDRAVEARAIGGDVDLEALIDGTLGAIYFRYLITGRDIGPRYVGRLFAGLAAGRAGAPRVG